MQYSTQAILDLKIFFDKFAHDISQGQSIFKYPFLVMGATVHDKKFEFLLEALASAV
jgi:hypothetical protein